MGADSLAAAEGAGNHTQNTDSENDEDAEMEAQ